MKNLKNGVTGIIVLSLFMVVSVISIIYLQDWFYLYKDDFENKINQQNFYNSLEIKKIDGTYLHLENNFLNNLKINNINCLSNEININKGFVEIDIGSCSREISKLKIADISIYTKYGIHSERDMIRNPINGTFIVSFQTQTCNEGYIRLLGLGDLDNTHVEIFNSNLYTYNLCIKSFDTTISNSCSGNYKELFYLTQKNNSAIWTNKNQILIEPQNWYPVCLSAQDKTIDLAINNSRPDNSYVCIGSIEEDNVYGSHFGTCNSTMIDKLWLSLK